MQEQSVSFARFAVGCTEKQGFQGFSADTLIKNQKVLPRKTAITKIKQQICINLTNYAKVWKQAFKDLKGEHIFSYFLLIVILTNRYEAVNI